MERVDADLVPFAQNNPSGYRFAFGTDTETDDINANYNDNIKKGWGTTPNEFPEVEDFNAMAYTIGYLLSYLYHMGIAEWNDKQKYRQYSRVIGSDGIIYKAKTGTDISPNLNNNPTSDTTNWEIDNQFNINGLTNKVTPADTDNFAIQEAGGLLKKLSWANLKTTLETYFDTLYAVVNSSETVAGIIELATAAEAQTGTDDLRAITPLKLRNALNANGNAPIYACRAWVNFNGTGTVAIRGSGNVSGITDNGVGKFTVNFTTSMPDANYFVGTSAKQNADTAPTVSVINPTIYLASSITVIGVNVAQDLIDHAYNNVSIFR